MIRRICVLGASAAALTFSILAGAASAATPSSFSGQVFNGSCGAVHYITVSGPSRIDTATSTTSASYRFYAAITDANGNTLAQGKYDTSAGGTYGIKVCTYPDLQDPPIMQYKVLYATGPAGQDALPHQQGQVLGAFTTLSRSIHGTGAIKTHAGLAWFTVKLASTNRATVRVYDPVLKAHFLYTGAKVSYLSKTAVRITRGTMTLTLRQSGISNRITFHSPRFKTSGWVVKGNFIIL
jgi:hypothetical protein